MSSILILFTILALGAQVEAINDRPIIGILSQELPYSLVDALGINGTYIGSSYVKWVELGGARAVPIIVNQDTNVVDLFQKINGLVIPGGAVSLDTSPYSRAGEMMYSLALNAHDAGDYFPVWGTCLGFELLAFLSNNEVPNLKNCDASNIALPLHFTDNLDQSRVFAQADAEIFDIFSSQSVTSNFHRWCLTMDNFTKFEMDEFWTVISTNEDSNGLEFISMIEAKNYPVYGVQFHPEKNNFEWTPKYQSIPHTPEAIKVSNYLAQFLVDEARKSDHRFDSREEEESFLIYNYTPYYVGIETINSGFQQVYVFPDP